MKWSATFLLCAAASAALANDLMMMGVGPRTVAAGGACSKILLNDGTSAILLNDGTSFLCLN